MAQMGPPSSLANPTSGNTAKFGDALGSLLGGAIQFGSGQNAIAGVQGIVDDSFNTKFAGNVSGLGTDLNFTQSGAQLQFDPVMQAIRASMGQNAITGLGAPMQTDLFNNFLATDPSFQQQQNALQQQFVDPSQINAIAGQLNPLAQQAIQRAMAGPQDLTGGLQNAMFGQSANFLGQLDQSALRDENLALLRARAADQEQTQINALGNALFGTGRRATTGGRDDANFFGDTLRRADLDRQLSSIGLAQQAQMQNANLANMFAGAGSGLLGQNLGAFNQFVNQASGLTGQQAALAGQQFQQGLTTQQQNLSQGQSRLQNALQMFGLQSGAANMDFARGQGQAASLFGQDQALMDAAFTGSGLNNQARQIDLEAARIQQQIAEAQASQGGFLGGLVKGAVSGFIGSGFNPVGALTGAFGGAASGG